MGIDFQAVLYSVERPYYFGMEFPPGGLSEADIPEDMVTRKETLYGSVIGARGSECIFPRGHAHFRILEVSDFMPFKDINKWLRDTTEQLELPVQPTRLSDLCDEAA